MKRPFFFLRLAVCAALLCIQCKRQDDFLILPLLAAGERLEISFNGRNLADEPGPDPEADLARQPQENPELHDGCLFSHPRGMYGLERGLKFRLCIAEMHAAGAALADNASLSEGRIELREYTKSEQASAAAVAVAVAVVRTREQKISIRAQRELFTGSLTESDIPSSFPCCTPAIVVEENAVSFLYMRGSRILNLRVQDASIAKRFNEAVLQTEQIVLSGRGQTADVFVSEIYFSSQGDPFVELSSQTDGAAETVLVSDLGERVELRGQIFAGAAVIVPIAFKSRIEIEAAGENTSILETSQAPGAGKSHSRSADFPGQRNSLLPSIRCHEEQDTQKPACHSRGIGPAYLNIQADDGQYCRPEDLNLRELNPFGFETNGALNPAGKFLEFEVLRDCESGRIVFYAPLEIDPGNRKLTRASRLVIVADAQFFSPGVLENSRLRSLAPDKTVQILSLLDRNYSVSFAGFPPEDLWIPRADGRVHSLIIEDSRILFHGPLGAGMRPDVAGAMSPGVSLVQEEGSVRLNELYPTGSYDSASIPADEFFETKGQAGAGLFALEVVRLRDLKRVVHRFPASSGISPYFAQAPVCFDTPFTRAALFLPNEAARYTLRNSSGLAVDEIEISAALYSLMEKDRRSLGQPWALSAHGGNCLRSAASPGMENEAAP